MADSRNPDRPDVEPTAPSGADGSPDTAAEIDPGVAQLLGRRPVDAGPLPTEEEIDTFGESG